MSACSPPGELPDRHSVSDTRLGPARQSASPAPSSFTSPLRISKRDSPQRKLEALQLARRSSNSYKHVRNNHLVSKSPFKSQIPTASRPLTIHPGPITPKFRRVSAEKRPRPLSMSDNDAPAPSKRRQSRGLERLVDREPVTRSPFKQRSDHSATPEPSPTPPPPPVPDKLAVHSPDPQPSTSPRPVLRQQKRLIGPRSNDGNGSVGSRRQRRKTVTFNECCDVVEFDQESIELRDEDPFYSDGGDDEEQDDDHALHHEADVAQSREASNATDEDGAHATDDAPHTPVSGSPLPPDTETEGGVPLGRTLHHDRNVPHRVGHSDADDLPPDAVRTPSLDGTATLQLDAITLERYHDRSTGHSHMRRRSSGEETPQEQKLVNDAAHVDTIEDVHVKDEPEALELSFISTDSLDPANLSIGHTEVSLSGLEEELGLTRPTESPRGLPALPTVAPLRLSASPSPRPSMSAPTRSASPIVPLSLGGGWQEPLFAPRGSHSPAPASPLGRRASPALGRVGSPLGYFSSSANGRSSPYQRMGSPLGRAGAEDEEPSGGSGRRSPRISRDDVQRKLVTKRSMESPLREFPPDRAASPCVQSASTAKDEVPPGEEVWIKETNSGTVDPADLDDLSGPDVTMEASADEKKVEGQEPPKATHLCRADNPTYDGVMSLDPEPQSIDPPRPLVPKRAYTMEDAGAPRLDVDFEQELARSRLSMAGMRLSELSALDRLMEDVGGEQGAGLKIEAVTEGVVAGRYDVSTDDTQESMDADEGNGTASRARPPVTDTALLSNTPFTSLPSSRSVSETSIPPPVPAKDAIRTREELIIEKRREARRRELDDDYLPPSTSNLGHGLPSTANIAGRPSRRRSMSTGDALDMLAQRRASDMRDSKLLDVPLEAEDDALGDSIDRELRKRGGNEQTRYRVREREETIYASSDTDRIRHMQSAGDLDSGQAWRTVRRPSDMNEYAKQIKEYRAQDKSGKSYGKVFVKVVGVKDLRVPIPREPTVMTCTLNNGIHYVTTPECPLSRDCHIGQEFELIEHPKLEFTLTLKVRRDAHIVSMCKALAPPPPVRQPPPAPPPSKGGLRSFFSSPKKTSHAANRLREVPPPAPPEIKENLARYLKPDGVLARAFISFKDVASRCDTKLFETSLPLLGQRLETASKMITTQVGEITLQIFRLPPLPGIPQDKLPQSLEECHDGLRHIHWHKQTYFEGTLTQSGGDCMTWRRRPFRVIGASLVAFNDVTKRATATIDLKKALAVRDDEEAGTMVPTGRYSGDDSLVGMERSFRILFPMNQEIVFFADTDDEKRRWLEVLRALVGRIPPNPLWAELIWQRQLEIAKHKNTSSISSPVAPSGLVPSRPNR